MTSSGAATILPFDDSFFTASLQQSDPELYDSIRAELGRQQDQIELIASENVVSRAVLEAQGSVSPKICRRLYGAPLFYAAAIMSPMSPKGL